MSKAARGFLELLAGRNVGVTPQTAMDEIRPTLEMHEFYASNQMLGASGAATIGAIAPQLNDEIQLGSAGLKAIGATFTCGAAAAANVNIGVSILTTGGGLIIPLGSIFCPAVAAGQIVEYGVIVPNWVPPIGVFLRAFVSGTAAGVDHSIDCHVLIENYPSN